MGFKSLTYILIFSLLLLSCSSINFTNSSSREYTTFNYLGKIHNSRIKLLNDETIKTKFVFSKDDSLYFENGIDTIAIGINKIESVTIKQWSGAIGLGIIVGLATTVVSGSIISATSGGGLGVALLGAGSGLILGIVSSIFTIIYGGESEYIFNSKAQYDQNQYYKERAKRDSLKN